MDYISRDDAIHLACDACNHLFGNEPCEPNDCNIMRSLKEHPAANVVEQKQGHWIEEDDGSLFYRCSVCGKAQGGNFTEIWMGEFHFCPNCGSSMVNTEFCNDCPYETCSISEIGSCVVADKEGSE